MLMAKPSDPNTLPLLNVLLKFFCQTFHTGEFFSKEKTPIFKCGAKANFLESCSEIPDAFACL